MKGYTTQDLNELDQILQDLGNFARPASQDEFEDYNSESHIKFAQLL
jgi:hypothetical protein